MPQKDISGAKHNKRQYSLLPQAEAHSSQMEVHNDDQGEFKNINLSSRSRSPSRSMEGSDLSGTTLVSLTQPRDSFQTVQSHICKSDDIASIRSNETEGGESVVYVSERPILLERMHTTTLVPKPWYSPSRLLIWFLATVSVVCLVGIILLVLHDFGVLRIGEEGPIFKPAPAPKSTFAVVIDAPTVASGSPRLVETARLVTVGEGIAKGRADIVVMEVVAILCMLLGTVVGW